MLGSEALSFVSSVAGSELGSTSASKPESYTFTDVVVSPTSQPIVKIKGRESS